MGTLRSSNASAGRPERERKRPKGQTSNSLRLVDGKRTSVRAPRTRKVGAGGNASPHYFVESSRAPRCAHLGSLRRIAGTSGRRCSRAAPLQALLIRSPPPFGRQVKLARGVHRMLSHDHAALVVPFAHAGLCAHQRSGSRHRHVPASGRSGSRCRARQHGCAGFGGGTQRRDGGDSRVPGRLPGR